MVAELLELNYNVRECVLDAADFGDPQHRKRVILLVTKKGMVSPREPVGTHGPDLMPHRTVRDAIGDLSGICPKGGSGQVVVGGNTLSGHCRDGTDIKSEETDMKPDQPATTLYGKFTNSAVHYKHRRLLTNREMARLQSFPDYHEFPSSRNATRQLIFNAVPVQLAHAVAKSVMECYDVERVE